MGDLSKRMRVRPNTCGGKGYWLVAADPYYWDVETVRVNCRGCADCKPKKKKEAKK